MEWLADNWDVVLAGISVLVAACITAWATLRAGRQKTDPPPTIFDANQIARDYAEESRLRGALEAENQQLREQLGQQDGQAEAAVAQAVADLASQAEQADDPDPFEAALAELREGRPDAAETLFRSILEERRAEGESALKDAARAARHIGAIAFYHDTQKSLDAYEQAVALDPDNAEGWNQLGHLRRRSGELDLAEAAFEHVLRLGNRIDDKSIIAAATGNLGLIHRTRGDLDKAEEIHLKALALEDELGRKEGMANQYGNLGNVYQQRGDVGEACRLWGLAVKLFEEIGAADRVAQVRRLMDEAGCGKPE